MIQVVPIEAFQPSLVSDLVPQIDDRGGDVLVVGVPSGSGETRLRLLNLLGLKQDLRFQLGLPKIEGRGELVIQQSVGVDGLISDRPGLARLGVTRRAELSDAQRFLVAILIRLGTRIEVIAEEVRP